MESRVLYWNGREAESVVADRWRDYPVEGVLWADLWQNGYHTRLVGLDNYWLHGDAFGVFNDPENYDWYPGKQAMAFRWTGAGSEEIEPVVPPGAHVLRGVMVPDEVARELGILGPGESSPPRPKVGG